MSFMIGGDLILGGGFFLTSHITQMLEDLPNHFLILDKCDDFHLPLRSFARLRTSFGQMSGSTSYVFFNQTRYSLDVLLSSIRQGISPSWSAFRRLPLETLMSESKGINFFTIILPKNWTGE